MEILPGIHHFATGPFNWYLLEEAGRFTLVDAGFPGHYAVFRAGLQQLGKTVRDLEAIVLTHSHADHTGFAARVEAEAGIPVWIHAHDRDSLMRPLNLPWYGLLTNAWRSYTRGMLLHATWNGVFFRPSVRKAQTFQDGEQLEVPSRPFVIHVPGHTPGEVAFYLPQQQVLLSGDTLVTRNLMTGQDGGPQLPHRLLNGNDQQARRSLDQLKSLGQVTMLPGHGQPWIGTMDEAVESARATLSRQTTRTEQTAS